MPKTAWPIKNALMLPAQKLVGLLRSKQVVTNPGFVSESDYQFAS